MQTLKDKGKFPADLADSGQSGMNESGTVQQSDTQLTQRGSGPVRYWLISPDGNPIGAFETAGHAASAAGGFWPGAGQDEERKGTGWDIEVVS